MITILYAEDDLILAKLCIDFLTNEGYKVCHVENGEQALIQYKLDKPDLVLLDVMMPNISGLKVAEVIREDDQAIPILFISSLGETPDVMKGFAAGADDYIRKEVMLEEVGVRVRARLRQTGLQTPDVRSLTVCEHVSLDILTRELRVNDKVYKLTPLDLRVMQTLCMNKNKYVAKETLLKAGWGNLFKETHRYLDKSIGRLRKMLPKDGPVSIGSSWGKGWGLIVKKGFE